MKKALKFAFVCVCIITIFLVVKYSFFKNSLSNGPINRSVLKEYGYKSIDDAPVCEEDPDWGVEWVGPDSDILSEDYEPDMSDINGWTVSFKKSRGLLIDDGSDTDWDGLTDKEEVEVYHSDPLKVSTSGDLYSDKVKVERGMDVRVFYEYAGDLEFLHNEVPEITITPAHPLDFEAYVCDVTDALASKIYTEKRSVPLKVYDIDYVYGSITIDVTSITKQYGISVNDLKVYVSYNTRGGGGDYADVSVNGSALSFSLDKFENIGTGVFVSVVAKSGDVPDVAFSYDNQQAIALGSPLLQWLFGTKMRILSTGDEKVEALLKENVSNSLGESLDYEIKNAPAIVQSELYARLSYLLPGFETKGNARFRWALFTYCMYQEDSADNIKKSASIDKLPFPNIGTYINHGGICAGIAHLTSLVNNGGKLPEAGTYIVHTESCSGNVEWNMTSEDNASLLKGNLSSVRDFSYFKDRKVTNQLCEFHTKKKQCVYVDNTKCTESDINLINMIGCFWQEANDSIGSYSSSNPSKTTINKVFEYIGNGNMVDVFMRFPDGEGEVRRSHAVNAYGYEDLGNGTYLLSIYDSNFPNENLEMVIKIRRGAVYYSYHPYEKASDYLCVTNMGIAFCDEMWERF